MPEHPPLGGAVRAARRRAGLTLRRLAADLEVSVGTMSAIENGKVGLTVDRLHLIAAHVGMPVTELLRLTDTDTAPADPPPDLPGSWREFRPLDLDPVLTSAVEVFTETGYHGATMRVIATGADISIAGMYHHYPSKQRLLVTLLERTLDDLRARVAAARAEAEDPVEQLSATVEAFALFHLERARPAYLLLSELRSVEEPDRSRLAAQQREAQDALATTAARAVDTARFDPRDLPTATRAITTMCLALPYRLGDPAPGEAARLAVRYAELARDMLRIRVQED